MKYYYDTEFLEGKQKPVGKLHFIMLSLGWLIIGFIYAYLAWITGFILLWLITAIGLALSIVYYLMIKVDQKPTIDLISIGMVSEDGREYYAISKDFNLKEAWNRFEWKQRSKEDVKHTPALGPIYKDYWIRDNVLIPIFYELADREFYDIHYKDIWIYNGEEVTLEVFKNNLKWTTNYKWFKKLIHKYGKSNEQIASDIQFFVYDRIPVDQWKTGPTYVQFHAYYGAYDHVALSWLFGRMIDLPKGFPMYTRDLKQILDEKNKSLKHKCASGISPLLQADFHSEAYNESTKEYFLDYRDHRDYPKKENAHNALSDARWNKKLHEFLMTL